MITAYGRAQVTESLATAEADLASIQARWYRQAKYVRSLRKAVACLHEETDVGGYLYATSICKQCGYTWTD